MYVTFDIIFGGIFAVAGFIGFGVSYNQLRKGFKYRFYQFSAAAWFCAGINGLLYGVGNLLFSVELYKIALITAEFSCLFTILCADTLKREQLEPVKMAILLTLIGLAFVAFSIIPNAVYRHTYPLGDEGLYPNEIVGLIFVAAGTISFVYYFHCAYLVNKRAPIGIKRVSRIYVTGVFLVLVATICFAIAQPFLPGSTFLIYSAGGLMMAYSFGSEPKLIFVLPFRALRLSVLHTDTGISLFTHSWNQQDCLPEENLFSGMLQGVSIIMRESLQHGNLQEIRVEGAIIIAYRFPEYPMTFMLATTRLTRSLRDSLKLFAAQFCEQFHWHFGKIINADDYRGAEALVSSCFPHIPVYT